LIGITSAKLSDNEHASLSTPRDIKFRVYGTELMVRAVVTLSSVTAFFGRFIDR